MARHRRILHKFLHGECLHCKLLLYCDTEHYRKFKELECPKCKRICDVAVASVHQLKGAVYAWPIIRR